MLEEKNDNPHEADGNLENNAVAFNEMEATVKTETVKQTASTPNEDTVEAIAEEVKPTDALILETGNQTVLMPLLTPMLPKVRMKR
jgi:hypothetical protein